MQEQKHFCTTSLEVLCITGETKVLRGSLLKLDQFHSLLDHSNFGLVQLSVTHGLGLKCIFY